MKQDKNRNLKLAKEWFLRAQDDELSAEDILKHRDGSPNTVCFLCQQMAEKYLKGFLVYHKKRFPKIHHLDRLLALCKKIDPQVDKLRKEAEDLSEFYISTRYPGDYPQFDFQDGETALSKAQAIKHFVLKRVLG